MIVPEFDLILAHENITTYQAEAVMNFLISDMSTDELRASFLAAMFIKGVTPEELSGFARSLRSRAVVSRVPGLTDVVGTGGDHKNTVNVSTAAAIVSSSCGVRIGKHGNYASTGLHGSADFLKKIGYEFTMTQNVILSRINELKFVFILANYYNEHFAKFSTVRRKLGFSSVLNYLGPITNPLDPDTIVIGCTTDEASRIYADVLERSGKKGCVVCAEDGMDEISPLSPTTLRMVNGTTLESTVYPEELDLSGITQNDITSKDVSEIFSKTEKGIRGEDSKVARFIAANSAPSLLLNGIGKTLSESYEAALDSINSGKAGERLNAIGRSR